MPDLYPWETLASVCVDDIAAPIIADSPWYEGPVDVARVRKYAKAKDTNARRYGIDSKNIYQRTDWTEQDHLRRIAHFVLNPPRRVHEYPIIDVADIDYAVIDGNHRIAAAAVRRQRKIKVVLVGLVDTAYMFFGCDARHTTFADTKKIR